MRSRWKLPVQDLRVSTYIVPTETPESDGTLQWQRTVVVLVNLKAGGKESIGYTYADEATATLIHCSLAQLVIGEDALDIPAIWAKLRHRLRNLGRPGIVSMAIAAIDNSLWDLKAKLLDLPLALLLGRVRDGVPVYGSGGFTSYSIDHLQKQLGGWAAKGIKMVKMKVGGMPLAEDVRRVEASGVEMLHVDIMDGHFVPNFTMGTPITEALRRSTKLRLDHHLMIEDPDTYAPVFIRAGATSVSVHYEVCRNLDRTLNMIRELGAQAGVVINPHTDPMLLRWVLLLGPRLRGHACRLLQWRQLRLRLLRPRR